MSNTRKLNILHELDVAIKRKTLQKSKQTKNKIDLLASIQKRRPSQKSVAGKNKSQDKYAPYTQKSPPRREGSAIKQQIFNNQNLKGLEISDKKFHNKRMDKLISLINYVLSSAQKVVKYVNITNFEAQFAVKLFRSDKETLLSELDGFNVQDLIVGSSQRSAAKGLNQTNANFQNHALKSQNMNLKKELMLIQAQCSRLKDQKISINTELKSIKHNSFISDDKKTNKMKDQEISNLIREIQDLDQNKKQDKAKQHQLKHHLFLKEKQVQKLSNILKQVMQGAEIQAIVQNLDKATKFNMIIFNNPENEKKKLELEGIITNLDKEYQLTVKEIVGQFSERQEVIKLLVEKVPEILEREIENINFDEIRLVELLQLLISLVNQNDKQNESNKFDTDRLRDLQQTIDSLRLELTTLSKQNQQLKRQNNKEKESFKELSAISSKLQKQNQSLQMDIEQYNSRFKELCVNAQVSVNDVNNMTFGSMIQKLRSIIKKSKQQNKQLNDAFSMNQKLDQNIKRLQRQNKRQQQNNLQQTKQLKIHLSSLQQENRQLQKHRGEVFELKKKVKESQLQLLRSDQKIKELQQEIEEARQLKESHKKLNIQVLKLQSTKDEYAKLKKSHDKLQEQFDNERSQKILLNKQIHDQKIQNNRVIENVNVLNNQIIDLKKQIQTISQAHQKQITLLQSNNKQSFISLQDENTSLKQQLLNQSSETQRLGNYTMQLSQSLNTKTNQLSQKDKLLKSKQQQVQDLKQQIIHILSQNDNHQQKYNTQLQQLKVTLKQTQEQLVKFQSNIKYKVSELQESKLKLSQKDQEISKLHKQQSHYKNIQNRISQLEDQISNYQNKLVQKQEHIGQLNIIISNQQKDILKYNQNEDNTTTLNTQIERLNHLISQYQNKTKEQLSIKEDLEQQIINLNQDIDKLKQVISQNQQQIQRLKQVQISKQSLNKQLTQKKTQQLQTQILSLQINIKEKDNIIGTLQQQGQQKNALVQELQYKLSKLQDKNSKQKQHQLQTQKKDQMIQQLNLNIQQLNQTILASTTQNNNLNIKTQELNMIITQHKTQTYGLLDNIKLLEEKQKGYLQSIRLHQESITKLEQSNKQIEQTQKQLNNQLQLKLQQSATTITTTSKDLYYLKQQYELFKSQIEEKIKQDKNDHEQINQLKQTIQSKQNEIRQLSTRIQHLFSTNTTLLQQNQRLYSEQEEKANKIDDMQKHKQQLIQEYKYMINQIQQKNKQLQQLLKQKQTLIHSNNNQMIDLQQTISKLNKQKQNITSQNIQNDRQEIRVLKQYAHKLQQQNEQLTNTNKNLTEQLLSSSNQIQKNKHQIQKLKTSIEQLVQNHQQQTTKLLNTIKIQSQQKIKQQLEHLNTIQDLNTKISKLQNQVQDLKEQKQEIEELKEEESKIVIELNEKLRCQMQKSERQVSELEGQINKLNKQLQESKEKKEDIGLDSPNKQNKQQELFNQLSQQIDGLKTQKQSAQQKSKELSNQVDELNGAIQHLNVQLNTLQDNNNQLIENNNTKQSNIDKLQEEIWKLKNQIQTISANENTNNKYKQQYQLLKRDLEQAKDSYKLLQMTHEHRMNLVKMIVKKITDTDDIQKQNIDDLLEQAIKIVIEWKNNQPKFDSATPKKYVSEEYIIRDNPNNVISLSGFCDENSSSGIGGSIIDKLGEEGVPSLNLQEIDSRKTFKKQISQPIPSIQDRLQYYQSGQLGPLIKTQESVNEYEDISQSNNEQTMRKDVIKKQQIIDEQKDSQKQDSEYKMSDSNNIIKNVQFNAYNTLIDQQQQPEWNEKIPQIQSQTVAPISFNLSQINFQQSQPIQQRPIQNKSQIKNQSNYSNQSNKLMIPQTNQLIISNAQKQDKQQNEQQDDGINDFSDFKDAGNTSQLDHSNTVQNQQHQQQPVQTNINHQTNEKQQTLLLEQIKQKQKQPTPLISQDNTQAPLNIITNESQVYSNDFSDFKDVTDNSQLDHSNIMTQQNVNNQKQYTPKQQSQNLQFGSQVFPDAGDSVNQSILSNANEALTVQNQQVGQTQFPDLDQQPSQIDSSFVQNNILKEQIKQQQNKQDQISASEFDDFKQPSLSSSMLSDNLESKEQNNKQVVVEPNQTNKQQSVQRDPQQQLIQQPQPQDVQASLGDFGDVQPSQDLSKSMINQQDIQKQQQQQNQQHGFNDFGSVHQSMSQSLVQQHQHQHKQNENQKQEQGGNQFSDFGNVLSEALDSSIISQKMGEQKQHNDNNQELDNFTDFLKEEDLKLSGIFQKD